MKFLCICEHGQCRSVALAGVVKRFGHDAVAVGRHHNGGALALLSAWADHILVMDNVAMEQIPEADRPKIVSCRIGPDRWGSPANPELRAIVRETLLSKFPNIHKELRQNPT